MTSKIYRSAQGKTVDLGTIMLQNEHVRAVGNMNVNARGDKLDSNNQVIETKPRQIQKQNERTSSNVSVAPVHTSSKKSRNNAPKSKQRAEAESPVVEPAPVQTQVAPPVQQPNPAPVAKTPARQVVTPAVAPVAEPPAKSPSTSGTQQAPTGGLAGAIARTREIKQELDRTRRQQAQDQGVRKI
jgi:hypothetical protein